MSQRKTTEENDLETIRKGFEMFDVDNTGKIFPEELLEAMDSMNMHEKNPYLYEIIESLCSEKQYKINGGIAIEELVNYVYDNLTNLENSESIRQNFDVINNKDTDTVSLSTFQNLAKDYGNDLEEEEIRHLLEKAQMGGEELNFDEFETIMKGAKNNNNNKKNYNFSNTISSRKSKGVYEKKNQNIISNKNSNDMSKRIRSKYLYNEPQKSQEKEILTTSKTTTTYQKNYEPENNFENENLDEIVQINYEIQENNSNEEPEKQENNPLKYSYRRVIVDKNLPKNNLVEEQNIIENNELLNDENFADLDKNININENNYKKETKITKLPDGTKQIEITEKAYIEDAPPSRGSSNRYGRYSEEGSVNNSENEGRAPYKVRRPRGNFEKSENSYNKVVESEEKIDVVPKRYHRRYRENKISTTNENEG